MARIKSLLLATSVSTVAILPTSAAPSPETNVQCLAPQVFLSQLAIAGDWVVKRLPDHVADAEVTGIVFRESGMIDVAVFQQGCLAMVVVVGEAPADIRV